MKNYYTTKIKVMQFSLLFILITLMPKTNFSQSLPMSDFVIFGGNGTNAPCTSPTTPGYGVIIGANSTVNGGSIGTYTLFKTNSTSTLHSNIHSGGKVELASNITVDGRISAANSQNAGGTILTAGSNSILAGNIDVNGNIVINSGSVAGIVNHPAGTTYSGRSGWWRKLNSSNVTNITNITGNYQFPCLW